MTDIYDQATDVEMRSREIALQTIRAKASKPAMQANGACFNCEEHLADSNALFCDADCRDDFQLRASLTK